LSLLVWLVLTSDSDPQKTAGPSKGNREEIGAHQTLGVCCDLHCTWGAALLPLLAWPVCLPTKVLTHLSIHHPSLPCLTLRLATSTTSNKCQTPCGLTSAPDISLSFRRTFDRSFIPCAPSRTPLFCFVSPGSHQSHTPSSFLFLFIILSFFPHTLFQQVHVTSSSVFLACLHYSGKPSVPSHIRYTLTSTHNGHLIISHSPSQTSTQTQPQSIQRHCFLTGHKPQKPTDSLI
jgi:hypothetical protein